MDVRITPEPSDEERAAIVAALAGPDGAGADLAGSSWLRVALREASETEPGYDSEPGS